MDQSQENLLLRDKRRKMYERVSCVLALVALIVVCSGVGKLLPSPLAPLEFDGPSVAAANEQGMVVADTDCTRLLFLDASHELVHAERIDNGEVPITEITCLAMNGNDVYVAGFTSANDGENIISESVLKYDLQGVFQQRIWERTYEEENVVVAPSVNSIAVDENGNVFITQVESFDRKSVFLGAKVEMIDENAERHEVRSGQPTEYVGPVLSVQYLPNKDACVIADIYGTLYLDKPTASGEEASRFEKLPINQSKGTFACVAAKNEKAVLYDSLNHTISYVDDLFEDTASHTLESSVSCLDLNVTADAVTATLNANELYVYDLATWSKSTISQAPLGLGLRVRSIAYYASLLYLFLFACTAVVMWVVRSIRRGKKTHARVAVLSIAIALICMVAMEIHAYEVISNSHTVRNKEVQQVASYLGYTSPRTIGDAANREAQHLEDRSERESDLSDIVCLYEELEAVLLSSFKSNMGVQCGFYGLSESGRVQCLVANQRNTPLGSDVGDPEVEKAVASVVEMAQACEGDGRQRADALMDKGMTVSLIHDDNRGAMVAHIAPLIAEDGTCRAAVEVVYHYESFQRQRGAVLLSSLFEFVMVAVSIYILSKEIITSGTAYLRFRELRKQGVAWAGTLLGRPLTFVAYLASGMDAALAVVIARNILVAQGMNNDASAWGLPALAIALGTTVGTLIQASTSYRVAGRRLALTLVLVAVLAQIGCGVAIVLGLFPAFIAGKFFSSAGYAGIFAIARNAAEKTADKDLGSKQLSLDVGFSASIVVGRGATVVGGVLGGFLITTWGDAILYFVAAFLCATTAVLFWLSLPKGHVISERIEEANLRNVVRFVLSPLMLATLAFAVFPTVLANGYKSYLMPLFLDAAGVSKSDISYLFAFGNTILYLLMSPLITTRDAWGRWRLSWVAIIGLGITFALYAFNQAPVWAVLSTLAITLFTWLAGSWERSARLWAKGDYGFEFDQARAVVTTEETLVQNFQQPVLTALLSFGGAACCLILGIFFTISGAAYGFITRHRRDNA